MLRFNCIRLTNVTLTVALVVVSLGLACNGGDGEIELVATSEDEAAEVVKTQSRSSLLEGVEIVRTVPPTAEGEGDVQPINQSGPRSGGVLAAPMAWCPVPDPAIDDAYQRVALDSTSLVTEIHAGLTRIVDDPAAPFILELADTYDVDLEGMNYEFVLRNDLKFSDGSALTSSDFKWSWERALKKSISGGRARDVFGLIEGADAVLSGDSEELTGVLLVDDRTLRVGLTKPRADFPALLADPVASVLKKDNVLEWGLEWDNFGGVPGNMGFTTDNLPVGAGPFKLVQFWDGWDGGRCAIASNPHYWGEPAYLDGVWYRPEVMDRQSTPDGGQMVDSDPIAFVEEAIDFEPVWLHVAEEDSEDGGVVTSTDPIEVDGAREGDAIFAPTYVFMVLNAAAPPFDDINFRRAAAAFAQLATYGGATDDTARLITEELTSLQPTAKFIRYDKEMAESQLAASKYANTEEAWEAVVMHSGASFFTRIEDPSFRSWAQELNITLEDDHYGVETLDELDGRNNNRYHLRVFDVSPRYPDPATVLSVLADPFGTLNRAPEFDELDVMLRDAATESDAVTRHEKYLAIEDFVADNALVIPIRVIRPAPTYRVHSWVHGFDPPKFAGSIFHKVWLDGTGPKRELPSP